MRFEEVSIPTGEEDEDLRYDNSADNFRRANMVLVLESELAIKILNDDMTCDW